MELKDVILSTLAEMEDEPLTEPQTPSSETSIQSEAEVKSETLEQSYNDYTRTKAQSELVYLSSIRERLLVLFEGFQSPNNSNIEAKVDMTLNFLEYTLATIDERVQMLEKGES